jgi:hypothetical protein
VIVRGQYPISVAAHLGQEVPLGHVIAQHWPMHLDAVGKPASSWVQKRTRKERRRHETHRLLTWKLQHQQRLMQSRSGGTRNE